MSNYSSIKESYCFLLTEYQLVNNRTQVSKLISRIDQISEEEKRSQRPKAKSQQLAPKRSPTVKIDREVNKDQPKTTAKRTKRPKAVPKKRSFFTASPLTQPLRWRII